MQEENKQAIQQLIERVWRRGRIDELPLFWTDDCVNHADSAPDKRGLAALRRYHQSFAASFADFEAVEIDVQQQIGEGDLVVTQMFSRGTEKRSQRRVSFAAIRIDRMRDGKIAEHWSVANTAELTEPIS